MSSSVAVLASEAAASSFHSTAKPEEVSVGVLRGRSEATCQSVSQIVGGRAMTSPAV